MEPLKQSLRLGQKSLLTGPSSIRQNVTSLMSPLMSQPRKKAITTLAKRNNISFEDAQFKQAVKIAQRQAKIIEQ